MRARVGTVSYVCVHSIISSVGEGCDDVKFKNQALKDLGKNIQKFELGLLN